MTINTLTSKESRRTMTWKKYLETKKVDGRGQPRKNSLIAMGFVAATLCFAQGTLAQSSDPEKVATAQTLYNEAVTLMDAKDYAAACPKLAEAVRLVPEGIGARLTLAECQETSGQLASAWTQYEVAKSMAERAGQKDRAARAAAKATSLLGQVSKLTIQVPADVKAIPQVSVTRRGVGVGEAQWGTAVPVDTGTHEIVVTAPGYKTWSKLVEVPKNGENITVSVEKPAPDDAPAAVKKREEAARVVVIQNVGAERPWQKSLGFGAIAAGGAGLVVGGILGGLAIQKNNTANDGLCDEKNFCKSAGLTLRQDAVQFGNASTAAMIVGGVALLGGVMLVATAPGKTKEKKALPSGIAATFEVTPGTLRIRGTF